VLALAALAYWQYQKSPRTAGPITPPRVQEEVLPASFTHEVRPLLANHCFRCHDGRQTSLARLDTPEVGALFLSLKNPQGGLGLPADSTHQDLLSLREASLLMRWRDEGAQHQDHWAFQPLPEGITPPEKFRDSPWVRNGIDQFTLQHLSKTHTQPTPTADPLTLLRRVTIDLTGLPPGLEEAEMLLASADPERDYQFFVDEYLASVEFGNTFSDLWLESIFYADPSLPADSPTAPFWKWRNWVIDWINSNRPIDEFLRAQLAGDLDSPSSREKNLATAIFRAPLREEAEAHPSPEQREANLDDRLYRLGHTFFGFPLFDPNRDTPGIDPVTASDREALRSLWRVEGESAIHPPGRAPGAPTGLLPTSDQAQALATAQGEVFHLGKLFLENRREELPAFEGWLDTPKKIPTIPDLIALFHCDAPGDELPNQALGMTTSGSAPTALAAPGVNRTALTLGAGAEASFSELCPSTPSTPWTLSFWIRLLDPENPETTIFQCRTGADSEERFFLERVGERLFAGWHRDGPTQSLLVTAVLPFEVAREWTHLTWTCDGSGRADGLKIYLNGNLTPCETVADALPVPLFGAQNPPPLHFGSPEKNSGTFLLDELHAYHRALTPIEVQHTKDQKGLFKAFADPLRNHADLGRYYFSSISKNERTLQATLNATRARLAAMRAELSEIPVLRGAPVTAPTEALFQGLFPPHLAPTLSSRLDLARWLTAENNPLTARVFVNRVWTHFFGEGLAPTGFGLNGGPIAQPELLDWLARDFVAHGWDLKRLCRQIVFSQTYRASLPAPRKLPRRTQRDVLLGLCGLLAPASHEGPPPSDKPWRALFLAHQPSLSHSWKPFALETKPLLPEEVLVSAVRQLTLALLRKHPDDDRACMRELFLRFRCQDESHLEFEILMSLLAAQKESFQSDAAGVPQLILGAGLASDQQVDPREWATWLEICTALLHAPHLVEQR
jgi:hypothetical protein